MLLIAGHILQEPGYKAKLLLEYTITMSKLAPCEQYRINWIIRYADKSCTHMEIVLATVTIALSDFGYYSFGRSRPFIAFEAILLVSRGRGRNHPVDSSIDTHISK